MLPCCPSGLEIFGVWALGEARRQAGIEVRPFKQAEEKPWLPSARRVRPGMHGATATSEELAQALPPVRPWKQRLCLEHRRIGSLLSAGSRRPQKLTGQRRHRRPLGSPSGHGDSFEHFHLYAYQKKKGAQKAAELCIPACLWMKAMAFSGTVVKFTLLLASSMQLKIFCIRVVLSQRPDLRKVRIQPRPPCAMCFPLRTLRGSPLGRGAASPPTNSNPSPSLLHPCTLDLPERCCMSC